MSTQALLGLIRSLDDVANKLGLELAILPDALDLICKATDMLEEYAKVAQPGLQVERSKPSKVPQGHVEVRVAIAVDPTGNWNSNGWKDAEGSAAMDNAIEGVSDGEARYWLTAVLPIPKAPEIKAEVEVVP
ncbi:hypothetical protein [Roseococcus pinisoli]|uniref:Uncharacterized protein n=1 Tax=Roseococcus pinisoli TaxID=2835040 RepID=A0ABS5QF34_9PROT|nr:hypothetical protein [Roseococcus pinisoli]MBS7812305.1 hypothetical protein [Roseococcus pinisoli]